MFTLFNEIILLLIKIFNLCSRNMWRAYCTTNCI